MHDPQRFRLTPAETRLVEALRLGPATSKELSSLIHVNERRVRDLLERVEAKGYWIESGEGRQHELLCEPEPDRCCARCRQLGRGDVRLAPDNAGPLCSPCDRAMLDAELARLRGES